MTCDWRERFVDLRMIWFFLSITSVIRAGAVSVTAERQSESTSNRTLSPTATGFVDALPERRILPFNTAGNGAQSGNIDSI